MCNENQRVLCGKVDCETCYKRSFAMHEKAPLWSGKNEKKPHEVFKCSHKKYFFNCDKCHHEFETSLLHISYSKSCVYCTHKKLCDNDKCQFCYENSFASVDESKFWSDKNDKKPREVLKWSHEKYFLNCNECYHEFEKQLSSISRGGFCPYCAHQKLCNNDKCNLCYENSFASHEKSEFWSDKNDIKPREVFKNSNLKRYFNCNECKHEFEQQPDEIIKGKFCAYCVHQKLCDDEKCHFCYENSFASHPKSEFWSDKNDKKPREVFKNSTFKYYFNCNCNHEFETSPNKISSLNNWCPKCKNKTEKILYDWLLEHFQHANIEFHKKFEWCKNNKTNQYFIFDFVINHLDIIIELDGEQHFSQVSNWTSPEETLERDKYKMKCANKNGYSVIRLLQEDVYNNDCNWAEELIKLLVKHKEPQIFCIASQIEKYDKHLIE